MNYCFVVGEVSADAYAAEIIKYIQEQDSNAYCFGFGGDKMQNEGFIALRNLNQLSFMGFGAVFKHWKTIKQNFKIIQQAILQQKADVVILIDYAGFNLRLAKWCKKNNIKIVYFILPKVWSWNEKRIKILQQCVAINIGIFPFEVDYFQSKHLAIQYYGNPSAYFIAQYKAQNTNQNQQKYIALFPGSRKQELHYILPTMLDFATQNQQYQFIIAGISSLKDIYPTTLPNNVSIIFDENYTVMQQSKFAIACSGTVSLELALFGIHHIVVYKTGFWHYQIGKRLAKVKYISLPNLIEDNVVVTELIQHDYNLKRLQEEFNIHSNQSILFNSNGMYNEKLYTHISQKIIGLAKK
ncbi:MAG: lipid-A-disaccharide synthase [Chitinophagales bacterium]|nr:lipid-A-disaccharide synthase [Chitinophagales bacterium]